MSRRSDVEQFGIFLAFGWLLSALAKSSPATKRPRYIAPSGPDDKHGLPTKLVLVEPDDDDGEGM